ncbi:hypothetical protein [Candidatus Sororendozoicomonas aggregata]|uniref:hypothetical protein n=1 Tax=Candidatus Sororendozoicomonas aggregata TaxID=3073239 RepID=UPI002ECFBFDB
MLIEQQLAAALLPLVDDRAYPVALPQNTTYPAITFHRVDSRRTEEDYQLSPVKARKARGVKSLFQVVAWSTSYSDCVTLLRQCKSHLEALPGVYLEGAADGYEHELRLYTCVMEFALWSDLELPLTGSNVAGDLGTVLDSAVTTLSEVMPETDIASVNPLESHFSASSIRLDIQQIRQGSDRGDGLFPATCSFIAWCCSPESHYQAADLAAKLLDKVQYNHWQLGAKVSHPQSLKAEPAVFRPGSFECWAVSWEQTVFLGETQTPESKIPDTVMAGSAPDIGFGHEDDYVQL